MDVQILLKCSWSYQHHPDQFTRVKSFTWEYNYLTYTPRTTYRVTTTITHHPEYLPLIQHGLHFIFSDNGNIYFKCFMILDDGEIASQNHVDSAWFRLENAKDQLKDVHDWQHTVLQELQTRKSILLETMQANEIYLPIDLHTIIVNYVFGITFLQISE